MRAYLLALLLAASPAWAETNVCTVISALPYTITQSGSYCLESDLALPMVTGSEIGIFVNQSSDVTLDCNGHSLTGNILPPGTGDATYGYTGIRIGASARVTVRNCRVVGFHRGIVSERAGLGTERSRDVVIEGNRVHSSQLGIYAIAEGHSELRDNIVFDAVHTALSMFIPPGQFRVSGNAFVRIGNSSVAVTEDLSYGPPVQLQGGGGWLVFEDNFIGEAIAPPGAPTPVVEVTDADIGIGIAFVDNEVFAPAVAADSGSATIPLDAADTFCQDNLLVGYGTTLPASCADPSNHAY